MGFSNIFGNSEQDRFADGLCLFYWWCFRTFFNIILVISRWPVRYAWTVCKPTNTRLGYMCLNPKGTQHWPWCSEWTRTLDAWSQILNENHSATADSWYKGGTIIAQIVSFRLKLFQHATYLQQTTLKTSKQEYRKSLHMKEQLLHEVENIVAKW